MRSRITITISKDLLLQVDGTIDNKTLRNRSQAIESLIRQVLKPQVSTAVILAGGPTAKRPRTATQIPRTLLPINDQPLIDLTLNHLKLNNFSKVIICIGKLGKLIQSHCGDGKKYGLEIIYSKESKPLGTGGALKNAVKLIPSKPFLVLHGDILTDINLSEFIDFYSAQSKLGSVAIKPRPGRTSYGMVFLQGSEVIDFKVPKKPSDVSLINTGIYIFHQDCLKLLPQKTSFKLENSLIPKLISQNQITGFPFQGIWYDISAPEDFHQANLRWKKAKQ